MQAVRDDSVSTPSEQPINTLAWKEVVARYQQPSLWRSAFQIVNSLVPYGVLWVLMYRSLAVSYWITLPLAILRAAFWCGCSSSTTTAATVRSSNPREP